MTIDTTRNDKQRRRLISLLEKLFQLDQPDLDFGFYKIMHAKAQTVSNFIQKDLLETITNAFGEADEAKIEEARLQYEHAIEQAKSFGAADPEATEPVQKAKAVFDAAKDSGSNEGEIYEHLYRFFERYYDNGDFMSRRYFARETGGKAAPYAVPYDGREVYLHWANRDQYYIKTSEYLTNFTFDIARHFTAEQRITYNMPDNLKLHCRLVEAAEGEHNNNKTTDKTERFFLSFADQPAIMEDGELVLQFEYRPDNEKSGTTSKWQESRIDEAESAILHALTSMGEAESYNIALRTEIGEDKTKRTLLRKYLNQYTKRNTTDYFIHKDLGSFLKRELDFYIKNEIMRLDDIEFADTPRVQVYLDKIKVLRKIAGQLITFLSQLEEFQKKLWLKKKFVTETQYCITLDRIPGDMYAEIAANDAQRKEWVRLFAIDELEGYCEPLSINFLRENNFLLIDTKNFSPDLRQRILSNIQNLDQSLNGTLLHGDNFQALQLLQKSYTNRIKCIYIDPPYNTSASEITYKNSYKHSSWASLMQDRLYLSKSLLGNDGILEVAIDDMEFSRLELIVKQIFGENNFIANVPIMHNPKGRDQSYIADCHEYTILTAKDIKSVTTNRLKLSENEINSKYSKSDGDKKYRELPLRRSGSEAQREDRPKMYFPFLYSEVDKKLEVISENEYQNIYDGNAFNDEFVEELRAKYEANGIVFILPIREDGSKGRWRWGYDSCKKGCEDKSLFLKSNNDSFAIYQKDEVLDTFLPKSLWIGERYDASSKGTNLLKNIVGKNQFDYPKSLFAVKDFVTIGAKKNSVILDFFGGSGTTGHAVVDLNREDGGDRKYIIVEMGKHFNTVLKPRMKKVAYSSEWKDGKPVSRDGISHAFKYIRLESYEDTLNNLSFKDDAERDHALQSNDDFRRDYMLKYWLEFETKGSSSLLNIEQFDDPTGYKLTLKKPGGDEYQEKSVDLVESFNWLIGLHVDHLDMWRSYSASFKREPDPELPDDDATRLILDGRMSEADEGKWLFRKVEGRICRTPGDMNNTDRVLVIWRKMTGNLEEDNLMLDEWFKKYRLSTQDTEFDVIYVNGSNNLPNLRQGDEHWKVRLIEEAFHQQMWNVEE
jgi:adenine-specific DNA-methyltransferase